MQSVVWIAVVLFLAPMAGAQPFPLPQDQSTGSTVTIGPNGEAYRTVPTPSGGLETIGPRGEIYQTIPTPSGGTVTYGPAGGRWETVPGPATPPPPVHEVR